MANDDRSNHEATSTRLAEIEQDILKPHGTARPAEYRDGVVLPPTEISEIESFLAKKGHVSA